MAHFHGQLFRSILTDRSSVLGISKLGVKPGTRPEPETRIFGQILWNRNPTFGLFEPEKSILAFLIEI
mgnify:CR=1 FL=1